MTAHQLQSFEWVDGGAGDNYGSMYSKNTLVLLGNFGRWGSPLAYIHKPKWVSDEEWTAMKAQFRKHMTGLDPISFEGP